MCTKRRVSCRNTRAGVRVKKNWKLYLWDSRRVTNNLVSMWLNLSSIFQKLSHDPDVRAVILTGAGDRAFTAGLDVQVRPYLSIYLSKPILNPNPPPLFSFQPLTNPTRPHPKANSPPKPPSTPLAKPTPSVGTSSNSKRVSPPSKNAKSPSSQSYTAFRTASHWT